MTAARQESPPVVYTVGHSTRPLAEFIDLLQAHGVAHLLDVRTVPRSRHNPQFNTDSLSAALETAGIFYTHIPGLGGFRRTSPSSPNGGWRCHRSLIADALVIRGIRVDEISSKTRSQPHALTSFARVKGTTITYPPPDPALAG